MERRPGDPNAEWSNEELIHAAEQGLHGSGAIVESMCRLKASNDNYGRWMFWLTVALTGLAAVQLIGVYPIVKGWFH